jgi:uncharacterized protein
VPQDWYLTNEMKAQARATINAIAGTKRCFAHAIFTPGYPGWMEAIDHALADLKPDSMKGYTIGDNTNKNLSKHPWRLDDEKLVYPAYEKFLKAGLKNVCIHKGLFPPSVEKDFPHLLEYSDVRDVGKAAKDWPQINFIIYHGGYRFDGGGKAEDAWAQFEQTGRIEWVSELAEIPVKFGVRNVYADVGQLFAQTTVAEPRLSAVMLGMLIKGMGLLGNRRDLDRRAAMADRGAAAVGNPRRAPEEIRLQAARASRWAGEERDLRRQQRAALQLQAAAARRDRA